MRPFRSSYLAGAFLVAAASAVSACGGGSSSAPFAVATTATPSSNPSSAPSSPAAITTSATVKTSTSAYVALPAIATQGIELTGTLPTANIAASVTATISVTPPSGVTAFAKRRDTAEAAPIAYVSFTSTSSVTLSALPALTFTLPSVTSGAYYDLAFDTNGSWQAPYDGPASASGDTVTFGGVAGSLAITPAQPAVFALYETNTLPEPVASPNSLLFDVNNPIAQAFTVSEPGYAGAFTAQSAGCANIAQVNPSTAIPTTVGGPASFTVTVGAQAGSCTVTITDGNSSSTTVSINVAQDQVIIYNRKRHEGAAR